MKIAASFIFTVVLGLSSSTQAFIVGPGCLEAYRYGNCKGSICNVEEDRPSLLDILQDGQRLIYGDPEDPSDGANLHSLVCNTIPEFSPELEEDE